MDVHVRDRHTEAVCDQCGFTAMSNLSLYQHRLLHSESMKVKSWYCDLCGRAFKHKHTLNKHIRKHGKPGSVVEK